MSNDNFEKPPGIGHNGAPLDDIDRDFRRFLASPITKAIFGGGGVTAGVGAAVWWLNEEAIKNGMTLEEFVREILWQTDTFLI
jgi:hypothetical protein